MDPILQQRLRAMSDRAKATRAMQEAHRSMPGPWRFAITGLALGLGLSHALVAAVLGEHLGPGIGAAVLAAVYGVLLGMRRRALKTEMIVLDYERRKADDDLARLP